MKIFFTIPFLSIVAAAVAAVPQVQPRTGGGGGGGGGGTGDCTAFTDKQLCCDGILGLIYLTCVVQLLDASCSTDTFCCQNDNYNTGDTLVNVNVNALNCINI